jgi:hypothetical protein
VADIGILASRLPQVENLVGLIQVYPLESSSQREKVSKIGANADLLKPLAVFPITAYLATLILE